MAICPVGPPKLMNPSFTQKRNASAKLGRVVALSVGGFTSECDYTEPMRWITREKAKVDRVACPRLIQKFIDPQAEFVFLPANTDWAHIKDAMVYDALYAECQRRVLNR